MNWRGTSSKQDRSDVSGLGPVDQQRNQVGLQPLTLRSFQCPMIVIENELGVPRGLHGLEYGIAHILTQRELILFGECPSLHQESRPSKPRPHGLGEITLPHSGWRLHDETLTLKKAFAHFVDPTVFAPQYPHRVQASQ
ncbi:hypothetical protein E3O19_01820 [Cryobacterium algoritolerans]|uniref:Uncharacterized protein n=1 Tax=Cryobacterium algoritolerans TaxID=1259184 RepID=A0A4R8WZU8_9MICO|nr:hypothetical protein [Cryobacterium algoritolerans]TFC19723.1 hypothetical protein E3O19_01820 [Cryobacterium algoritolerans]